MCIVCTAVVVRLYYVEVVCSIHTSGTLIFIFMHGDIEINDKIMNSFG